MNRADLRELATTRLEDARTLLRNERFAGAYYLAGYAIECALKACIAKRTREHDFPDKNTVTQSWTHDLEKLVKTAQMELALKERAGSDETFARCWNEVKEWSEDSRYDPVAPLKAQALLRAIEEPGHGVFPWLREYW